VQLVQPEASCPNCWRAWFVGPRGAIGYCWHGKVAWRLKAGGELAIAPEVTRPEYRAMIEYTNDIDLIWECDALRLAVAPIITYKGRIRLSKRMLGILECFAHVRMDGDLG
jgi:hypothetical protein